MNYNIDFSYNIEERWVKLEVVRNTDNKEVFFSHRPIEVTGTTVNIDEVAHQMMGWFLNTSDGYRYTHGL